MRRISKKLIDDNGLAMASAVVIFRTFWAKLAAPG
jgi:hypothetical protein